MIKKYLCFVLCCLLLVSANSALVSAQTDKDKKTSSAEKIKEKVLKRGTGKNKRVEVTMLDGRKLKGYISQASENSFTVTDSETNADTAISYSDVAKVKRRYSKSDKIILGVVIGAAATVAVIVTSVFLIRCRNEGGC